VQADPRPRGLAYATGQAIVVGMKVRHHHGTHIVDGTARFGQPGIQGIPGVVRRPPRVDEGHAVVELEHVDRDVAQRVVGNGHRDGPHAGAHLLTGAARCDPMLPLRGAR